MKEIPEYPVIGSDFSSIEGTRRYCSPEAAGTIREAVGRLPLKAVHLIGTGDYHYVSLFWLERIREPFILYLFDHHPDNQPGAFSEDMLSCGNWAGDAVKLPLCKGMRWIKEASDYREAQGNVYLSIDLDVLSGKYARTNWDQGDMTLSEICASIMDIREKGNLLGADICGGLDGCEDLNAGTMETLCRTINGYGLQ